MLNSNKPTQKVSWAEKIKDDFKFFKNTGDYYISGSTFLNDGARSRIDILRTLYEAYNSKFPASWFKSTLDPFNTGKPIAGWTSKIKPLNILRPNVEFLRGEMNSRPFNYQVIVKGEDGYNAFMEAKKKAVYDNISQIFINGLNEAGLNTGVESQEVEQPPERVSKFQGSFKNILAVQAQTDIDLIIEEQKIHEKIGDLFKDWCIAGEVVSYKNVIREQVVYERVSPLEVDYDKSPHVKYIQDGEWVVRRMLMVPADVVDRFYDSLSDKDIADLDNGHYGTTLSHNAVYSYINNKLIDGSKVPVYHYCWRGLEKFGILNYPNPITGKMESDIVNEDYKPNKELGETVEWHWRSKWYEGYRIGDDLHVEMGQVRFDPGMMNDLGKCVGPYNGRRFSDTHAENISPLKLGLPFQMMYIITNFTLERTLAKSRGKVALIDQNAIPKGDGWSEEKFFQFSEAQGWMVINRNQLGVDKSFNQYQVLDMGMFDHIAELIKIMDFCVQQYDQQLGISRPAKAQTTGTDTSTGIKTGIFQTSVITDMIFTEFEQFRRTDLDGLLDCSQISNINGKRATYISGDDRTAILNIIGEEYSYAQMGIIMSDNSKEYKALEKMRANSQAFAQNGTPPSAILELELAGNVAKVRQMLLNVEREQQELAAQTAENEQQAEMDRIQLQQQFQEYNNLLDIQRMHEEYNRKEDLVLIQGDINMALEASAQDGGQGNDFTATEALMNYTNESRKISEESDRKNRELNEKVQSQKRKENLEAKKAQHDMKLKEKEQKINANIKEKELQIKRMAAKKKPASK